MTLPCGSVMLMIVLLNVLLMCAWPTAMFLRSLRRTRVLAAFFFGAAMLLALLLRADLAARTLAGTRVRVRALAAHRQAAAMAKAAVAADLHEPLDVLAHLAAEVALDLEVAVDVLAQADDLLLGEVAHPRVGVDAGLPQDLLAVVRPIPKM